MKKKRKKKKNLVSLQFIFLLMCENWLSISISGPKVTEFNNFKRLTAERAFD